MGLPAQSRTRVGASCVGALLALLATSVPAAAARKPITGKLSKPGYTVIALAANGKAKSVRAKRGRFRLRPSAKRVTLHLRAPNGKYAGPIVVSRKKRGRRAILGVRAGARLGRIKVRRGYAKVSRKLPKKWVDPTRTSRARKGVPIGAGRFGRVRSKPPRSSPRADRDLDGIPDPLDIDDDGDLIFDNQDRSRAARAAQVAAQADELFLSSNLTLSLEQTVNANAAALTAEQADTVLARDGALGLSTLRGDSVELDCGRPQSRTDPLLGGLVYCTRGGTGRVQRADFAPFPDCCDADGDGFGTLPPSDPDPKVDTASLVLLHGATTAQIGTGDVLIERVTTGGVETEFPITLQYVFATVPALVSYDDGQGNSATVPYPVPAPPPGGVCPPPGPPCSAPGTRENGFPVKARANGDVVVTLTFWRPQRRPTPPETGEWIDIGRLSYTALIGDVGEICRQSAFSEKDPNLVVASPPINLGDNNDGGFTDLAADRPASAANTFTYTLNLSKCLAAHGRSFNPGQTRQFAFAATASSVDPDGDARVHGDAQQYIAFKRQ